MKDYATGLALSLLFGGVALVLAHGLWSVLATLTGLGIILGVVIGYLKPVSEKLLDEVVKTLWQFIATVFVLLALSLLPAGPFTPVVAWLAFAGYFMLFYAVGFFLGGLAKVGSVAVQVYLALKAQLQKQ